MKPIRLLNLGSIPAGQTQAIYHVLAERMDDNAQDTIVICRPDEPYLCLGYHQVFDSIFDADACEQHGLSVYRRRLGGGATYLDGNQIFYQCIFHHSHMPAMVKDMYAFALAAPVMVLRSLGLEAELRDTNEIEVNGKRIAGTGAGQIGEAIVVVGNLLLDFNFEAMTAVWQVPSTSFRLLAQKALRQNIVCLNTLAQDVSIEKVINLLTESFTYSMGRPLQSDSLSSEELRAIEAKSAELSSADFLALHKTDFSSAPVRELKISARVFIRYAETWLDEYEIKGTFWLREEIIQEAVLISTPEQHWFFAESKLRGTPFKDWIELLELPK